MKKCIIIILTALLMFTIVSAIEDCKGIMVSRDIPCSVISSWQFPNSCNTYNIRIFNETPTLLNTVNLDDYGISGRCNITFNYTKQGSYLLNWSSGDSSKIIVEGDESMQIAIAIVLSSFAILFVIIGIFLYSRKK